MYIITYLYCMLGTANILSQQQVGTSLAELSQNRWESTLMYRAQSKLK